MIPLTDKKVVIIRNQALQHYTKKEVKLYVGNNLTFSCSLIGSAAFKYKVEQQLKSLIRGSYHGKVLLQELAKLPKTADIVEYQSNHAVYHNDLIVILFSAFIPQGYNEIRFENEKGKPFKDNVRPDMSLVHELFHVGQLQKATFFEPCCNWAFVLGAGPESDKLVESQAIKYTNQIRIDKQHKRIRTHYEISGGVRNDSYKNAIKRAQQ